MAEHKLLKKHRRDVEKAVKSDLKWMADELNDDDIAVLNGEQYDEVVKRNLLSDNDKAVQIVGALLNRVDLEPDFLGVFVTILKKNEPKYRALIPKLDTGE